MYSDSQSAPVVSMDSSGVKFYCLLVSVNFKEHLSITTSGQPSSQPLKTINCFYYSIYFKNNHLEK